MPVNISKLSERIKYYRSKQNMSQEQLAELINQSRTNVYRIESGDRLPSLDVLIDIANALKVSTDDLLLDNLENSKSLAGSQIHDLLLDCNSAEERILTKVVKALKEILYAEGI